MSASRMISLRVGGGRRNGGDGILGSGDDRGNSRDGGGNGGAGAASQRSTNASMEDGQHNPAVRRWGIGGLRRSSSSSEGSRRVYHIIVERVSVQMRVKAEPQLL
ncbi:hypothetical protein Tco_1556036 [Tanacetum coccineum]